MSFRRKGARKGAQPPEDVDHRKSTDEEAAKKVSIGVEGGACT